MTPRDEPGSSVLKIHARLFRMSQIVYFIVKTTEMKYLGFRAAYCGILPYPHTKEKKKPAVHLSKWTKCLKEDLILVF